MFRAPYTLQAIPSGREGVRATLSLMGQLVQRYKTSQRIRELAVSIARQYPKNYPAQAEAIQEWVRGNIAYVLDVAGVETLQTPIKTLELRAGDCDDHSILVATMLAAVGLRSRFVAVGVAPEIFSHVVAQVKIGPKYYWLETTQPWRFGEFKRKIQARMEHHN